LGTATARRINQLVGETEVEIPAGNTIHNIAEALRTGIEGPRTGSGVRHVETPSPTVKRVPDSRLAGRAAICQAIELAALVSVTGRQVWLDQAIDPAEEEQTASEAVMYRAAEVETETRLEAAPEVPRDTTDRVRAPVAAAVPPVWDREAEVEVGAVVVAVVVGAAGRLRDRESE
jgi:hypothetical protein